MSQTPPPSRSPDQKSSGGCGKALGLGCLTVIVLIVVLVVGGTIAFRTGALTANKMLNIVGLGPAQIEVDNFRDDAILVTIRQLDASSKSSAYSAALRLKAFDIRNSRIRSGGRYQVDFSTERGNGRLGTCRMHIRGGDHYQFVALPQRIAVNRANWPSSVGKDFVLRSSSLCR
jgi:hypothetical protein